MRTSAGPVLEGTWAALDRAAGAGAHRVLVDRTTEALSGLDTRLFHSRSLRWTLDAFDGNLMTTGIAAGDPATATWYVRDVYPELGISDEIFAKVDVARRGGQLPSAPDSDFANYFGMVSWEFDPARVTPTGVLALNAYDAFGWARRHQKADAIPAAMAEQLAMRGGFFERVEVPPHRPNGESWLIHEPVREIDPATIKRVADPATSNADAVDELASLLLQPPKFGIEMSAEAHLRVTPSDATRVRVTTPQPKDADAVKLLLGDVPETPERARLAVRDALAGRAELWGVQVT